MGRPLFSTYVLPPAPPAVRVADVEAPNPIYEKWSPWNSFDPDSDEYWKDREEFEDFLSEQDMEDGRQTSVPSLLRPEGNLEDTTIVAETVSPNSISSHVDIPNLIHVSDDSSSDTDSGRSSPFERTTVPTIIRSERGSDSGQSDDSEAPEHYDGHLDNLIQDYVNRRIPDNYVLTSTNISDAHEVPMDVNPTGVTYISPDTYQIANSTSFRRPRMHTRPRGSSLTLTYPVRRPEQVPFPLIPVAASIHDRNHDVPVAPIEAPVGSRDIIAPSSALRMTSANDPRSPNPPPARNSYARVLSPTYQAFLASMSANAQSSGSGTVFPPPSPHTSRMALSHIAPSPPAAPYLGPLRLDS